jgi:hypothetical protein
MATEGVKKEVVQKASQLSASVKLVTFDLKTTQKGIAFDAGRSPVLPERERERERDVQGQ